MGVRNLAFSVDEYRSRTAKVQAAMQREDLDALLIHDRASICYLAGVENCYMTAYYAAVVLAQGEPILLASEFEILNALVGGWSEQRVSFAVREDPIRATCRLLLELNLGQKRIGIQPAKLSAERYEKLRSGLPDAKIVDAGAILPAAMLIKSPAEIAYLRDAGRLSTLGMEAAFSAVAAGRTDNDVAAAAAEAMLRAGSEFMCIDPIVTVGERSGIPHSTFRRTTLQAGDAIFIEVGGCMCRYSAPLMRTAAIVPISDEIQRATDACRDSLNALLAAMRPGSLARDAAAQAKAAWRPLCEELIWHGTYAYSVGLGFPPDWNDAPACISEESELVLEPGMCFHATTTLRRAARFGVAMSETILISDSGHEVLTGTSRALRVVH